MSKTLIQDVQENNPFALSTYGEHLALGFHGAPDFVNRCYNWACNTGVIGPGSKLLWYYGEGGRVAYVCPKSLKAIKNGLFLQFQAEIILAQEIGIKQNYSRDDLWLEEHCAKEKYDESPMMIFNDYQIARLAAKRVKQFLKDHLIRDSFFLSRPESIGMEFSLASKGRADIWDN